MAIQPRLMVSLAVVTRRLQAQILWLCRLLWKSPPLPELSEPETVVTVSVPTTASIAPPEVEIPGRRGRTRSSAVQTPAAKNTTSQAATSQAATAVAVVEPELDESGEPRRRRRRSSASS